MLYEDAVFKTLSDRYTNSRMVLFLIRTCIDGVRADLLSINPQQNMTPTMVNQQLFFFFCFFLTVKLDATNSFPSNSAEVRPIDLKMGHIIKKPVFVICEQQRRRSASASTQSDQRFFLFAAWIVTRFYSLMLNSSIGTYTVSPTCQFAESIFRYMYMCLSLSFTLQERGYTDSVSLCRFLW